MSTNQNSERSHIPPIFLYINTYDSIFQISFPSISNRLYFMQYLILAHPGSPWRQRMGSTVSYELTDQQVEHKWHFNRCNSMEI